ncbi:MAG: hypothetical protein HQL08_09850 [Nitrospirae bacterium]|nr:hypothetical protein [Nitrospirota bacterium]
MGYLFRSINVLNVLLAITVIFSAYHFVLPAVSKEPKVSLLSIKTVQPQEEGKKAEHGSAAPLIDYTLIADQNLFHPDRKIPVDKPAEKPLPKPEFVLYGTVVTDGMSLAYIDDKLSPISTPGRGKRVRVLKKGDSLSGFTLRDVGSDMVVMARGTELVTVNLMDAKERGGGSAPAEGAKAPTPPVPGTPGIQTPAAQRRRLR